MLTVEHLMQRNPKTVPPDLKLTELERRFLTSTFAGFPVVDGEELVGVISRTDIVRSLVTEQTHAEQVSDFYRMSHPDTSPEADAESSLSATATMVGQRFAELQVSDAMSHNVVSIEASESIRHLAELMVEGHLHRIPVVKEGRLVGLVTSMDLVAAIAQGRLEEVTGHTDTKHLLE